MGQEIEQSEFSASEYHEFWQRLQRETATLKSWLDSDALPAEGGSCGFELEGWLLNSDCAPAPYSEVFLRSVNDPQVVPELSLFNFEINSLPQAFSPGMFSGLQRELGGRWQHCCDCAERLGLKLLQIGILPTLRDEALCLGNISPLQRYHALNQQVLNQRRGHPIKIDITGDEDQLSVVHTDVMSESATTSLQIHLQVKPGEAVRFFNAAQIMAAPMVAISANSPYLLEHELWEETRIPLFEQAVSVPAYYDQPGHQVERVTFGTRYVEHSLIELFEENLAGFPVLLPALAADGDADLHHLRLHNGTIWRWNRPLIGFDSNNKPHLRLEHRVAPSGPSVPDTIANILFFYGLIHCLATHPDAPEKLLPFEHARANFYQAARYGLDAQVFWLDGREHTLSALLLEHLRPATRQCLLNMGIQRQDTTDYMDNILTPRVRSEQTGACWQKRFIRKHGRDFTAMTHAYYLNQSRQIPVHQWTV